MSSLKLTKLGIEDLELVRHWRNSKDVAKYMYDETIITENDQKLWYESILKSNSNIYWIIEYNYKKIGLVSVTNINKALQSCYWAFYLGDESTRGSGIGAKVEYEIIEYVFSTLGLNKLRCEVFISNEKVIKLHDKFGFKREAYYREHCIKENEKFDVIGLGLLKSDWDLIKESIKKIIFRN
jgi:UDP-4-amino-4,6-dideoxy-N-acetyl-beta-L-altrosamine N-acetyltransferase